MFRKTRRHTQTKKQQLSSERRTRAHAIIAPPTSPRHAAVSRKRGESNTARAVSVKAARLL